MSTFIKGNIWQQVLSFHFILELFTTIPFAITVSAFFKTNIKIYLNLFKIIDILSSVQKFIYTHISKLLVSQKKFRKYVCEYINSQSNIIDKGKLIFNFLEWFTSSNAKISISLISAVDNIISYLIMFGIYKVMKDNGNIWIYNKLFFYFIKLL